MVINFYDIIFPLKRNRIHTSDNCSQETIYNSINFLSIYNDLKKEDITSRRKVSFCSKWILLSCWRFLCWQFRWIFPRKEKREQMKSNKDKHLVFVVTRSLWLGNTCVNISINSAKERRVAQNALFNVSKISVWDFSVCYLSLKIFLSVHTI